MTDKTMLLSATLMSGYGTQGQAWRAPENATDAYTDIDVQVKLAQTLERGKFAFLFAPDFPGASQDMEFQAPASTLDPIVTLSVLAHQTSRIGFVATGSTTYNEPYNLADSSRPSTSSAADGSAGTQSPRATRWPWPTTASRSGPARSGSRAPTR